MDSKRKRKEEMKSVLSVEEMLLIRGGIEPPDKPKTPSGSIIQPWK